jgi:hypothetical protein
MTEAFTVVDHPIVAHRLTELRDERTDPDRFRQLMAELATFVAYEALGDLGTSEPEVRTPMEAGKGRVVTQTVLVVPGVEKGAPNCDVAHLGRKRDEPTLSAVCHLDGLPADLQGRRVGVCDPKLATSVALAQACQLVASRGPPAPPPSAWWHRPPGCSTSRPNCPRWRWSVPRSTQSWISTAASFPVWGMPGTGSSGRPASGWPSASSGADPPPSAGPPGHSRRPRMSVEQLTATAPGRRRVRDAPYPVPHPAGA